MSANSIAIAFLLAALSLLVIVVSATVLLLIAEKLDRVLNPAPEQAVHHVGSDIEFSMWDGIVAIPLKFQLCTEDSDCVVVADHCGACSCGEEMNKKHMTRYESQFGALCGIYFEQGKVLSCDIYCKPRQTKCIEGICSS